MDQSLRRRARLLPPLPSPVPLLPCFPRFLSFLSRAPGPSHAAAGDRPVACEALEQRLLLAATPVGVNLEGLADWARSDMFVDAMATTRAFGSASTPWDTSAPVDSSGWPTGDAGSCVITLGNRLSPVQDVPRIDGTYHFSATGNVTLAPVATNAYVTNRAYNAATNTTTADLVVNPGATNIYLSFTGAVGGTWVGAKNIKLIRPGYAANTTQVFTNEFLASLKDVQTLRLMDYLATNGNPVANWSDRSHVTDARQDTPKGGAWEYAIALANTAQKDLWINIPVSATDDYVQQLATFLKNALNPGLKVYVEYSNEVWNASFPQYSTNYNAAQAEAAANPSVLNYDGSNNGNYIAWRRIAERLVQIKDLFAGVYGASAINTTIRPVLASQLGYTNVLRTQLAFLEHQYGNVASQIYAVAGAPYLNIGSLSTSSTLTTDQVLAALQSNLAAQDPAIQRFSDLATYYGLKHLYYEGGTDLAGDTSGNFASAKLPANYDPRMGQILTNWLNQSAADGVEQAVFYAQSGDYTTSGCWGLTENIANTTGYRYTALSTFANTPAPAITAGRALPTVGNAITFTAADYTLDAFGDPSKGPGDIAWPYAGATYDYLLNAGTSSPFTIAVSAASAYTDGRLELLLDDKPIATLAVPNTGSMTTYQDITVLNLAPNNVSTPLTAGLHTLRLQVLGGNFTLHALTITASDTIVPTAPPPPPSTTDTSTLTAPTDLAAISVSATSITLTWHPATGQSGYLLQRSRDGRTWTSVTTLAPAATTYTDPALSPHTHYYYRLCSLDPAGTPEALSNILRVRTLGR